MALDTTIGGAASDSYITLVEFQDYWAARNVNLTQHGRADQHEAELRQAAAWIDRNYSFVGYKQYQTQSRSWPRITTALVDGWPIDPDTIPQDIKDAQAELAYLIHDGLVPWATIDGVVASESAKAGPVETTTVYAGGKGKARILAIEGLLRPYLGAGGSGQFRVVR
jgi:hypothetical protein